MNHPKTLTFAARERLHSECKRLGVAAVAEAIGVTRKTLHTYISCGRIPTDILLSAIRFGVNLDALGGKPPTDAGNYHHMLAEQVRYMRAELAIDQVSPPPEVVLPLACWLIEGHLVALMLSSPLFEQAA